MRVWQILAAFERRQSSRVLPEDHIPEEDLERFALDAIEDISHLPVVLHTSACEKCRKKLEEFQFLAARLQTPHPSQLQAGNEERRSEPRHKIRELAIVSPSRPSDFEPFECFVTDVSEFGLRIRAPREIYKSSDVRLRVENAVVFGKVRYSRRIGDAFDSGIAIEQVIVRSDPAPAHEEDDTGEERVSTERVEILLVEDNPADVKLTRVMLQDTAIPHNLTVATDGAEALKLLDFRQPKPDLVLLDLNLPKVNGFDVLRHIRSAQALRTIRVVILSGSSAAHDVQKAQELGVEAYIQKPEQFDQYAEVGSRIATLIHPSSIDPSSIDPSSARSEPRVHPVKTSASTENKTLMALLKARFSQVTLRSDGRYEIDRRILLSAEEAEVLVEDKLTLEEILVNRNRPSHLIPEHVRKALRRSDS